MPQRAPSHLLAFGRVGDKEAVDHVGFSKTHEKRALWVGAQAHSIARHAQHPCVLLGRQLGRGLLEGTAARQRTGRDFALPFRSGL
jgi:hypothetical protein